MNKTVKGIELKFERVIDLNNIFEGTIRGLAVPLIILLVTYIYIHIRKKDVQTAL